jgi:hypothetical protein
MPELIATPPKLYLDTGHIVNLARLRKGNLRADQTEAYGELNGLIRERHVGIIFNAAAPLEWVDGNATEDSARELARVIQSARLHYCFSGDQFAYLQEVLVECKRISPFLTVPDLPILQPMVQGQPIRAHLGYLAKRVPGYIDAEVVDGDLTRIEKLPESLIFPDMETIAVEAFRYRIRRPNMLQERVDGFRDSMATDLAELDDIARSRPSATVGWMKHFLHADRVISAFNPDAEVQKILEEVDQSKCPALHLWRESRFKRLRAGFAVRENDSDDWASLPMAIYADVMLTERQLCEFILQGDPSLDVKVTASVKTANEILRQMTS